MTDLVIFDCDGVLVDSEPLANRIMATHITRLGWPMREADSVRHFKGKTMTQVHAAVEARIGRRLDSDWLDAFRAELKDRMKTELELIPGVRGLIDRVHAAGLKSCVASQGRPDKMQVSLGTTGLHPIFEGRIFSATQVEKPKPAPDLFLFAARTLGVPSDRCTVIEDSPTGVAAALEAGMRVIGYDATGSGELDRDGVRVVDRMDDISITA
jgi:HAD superfamily hydrolase (TIGR01509 family)